MVRKKLSYAQRTCIAQAAKLLYETKALRPGARIGVALSGGVDSWVLLKTLMNRCTVVPFRVELMILHLNPGFDQSNHAPLVPWLEDNGLPGHVEVTDYGLRAHSEENRKNSACFYCAMLRRKRLFQLCEQYNLTHLALGHNMDDLTNNFFMNLFLNGRVDGLLARDIYFEGRMELIRPLLFTLKRDLKKACRDWGLPMWSNPCPSSGNSSRTEFHRWVEEKFREEKRYAKNVHAGLARWQLDMTMQKLYPKT